MRFLRLPCHSRNTARTYALQTDTRSLPRLHPPHLPRTHTYTRTKFSLELEARRIISHALATDELLDHYISVLEIILRLRQVRRAGTSPTDRQVQQFLAGDMISL